MQFRYGRFIVMSYRVIASSSSSSSTLLAHGFLLGSSLGCFVDASCEKCLVSSSVIVRRNNRCKLRSRGSCLLVDSGVMSVVIMMPYIHIVNVILVLEYSGM